MANSHLRPIQRIGDAPTDTGLGRNVDGRGRRDEVEGGKKKIEGPSHLCISAPGQAIGLRWKSANSSRMMQISDLECASLAPPWRKLTHLQMIYSTFSPQK